MEIVIRALILFLFIWILLRVLGKRELAELTTFELALVIVMGDLVQQGVTQEDYSVTGAILAVGTIGLWIFATSYLSFKWKRSRTVLEGMATLIVQDGELLREAMKIERLNLEDLFDAARQQGILRLSEVRYGILEPDGKFSFIKAQPQEDQTGGQEHEKLT